MVVGTPRSGTEKSSLYHSYVAYLPYCRANALSSQTSQDCVATGLAQPCFSWRSMLRNNLSYCTAESMVSKQGQQNWLKIECDRELRARQRFQDLREAWGDSTLPCRTAAAGPKPLTIERPNASKAELAISKNINSADYVCITGSRWETNDS